MGVTCFECRISNQCFSCQDRINECVVSFYHVCSDRSPIAFHTCLLFLYVIYAYFTKWGRNRKLAHTIAVADIGGKFSGLLGTFTLFSGVLLPLSARQCICVNSKYVLCSLCSYSLETTSLFSETRCWYILTIKCPFEILALLDRYDVLKFV